MTKQDHSRAKAVIHEASEDPNAVGLLDEPTMREFDAAARREAEVLQGAPEEQEALDFIEAAMRNLGVL
jgi:hypothetical protein